MSEQQGESQATTWPYTFTGGVMNVDIDTVRPPEDLVRAIEATLSRQYGHRTTITGLINAKRYFHIFEVTRECQDCGREFEPPRRRAHTCSRACKVSLRRRKARQQFATDPDYRRRRLESIIKSARKKIAEHR